MRYLMIGLVLLLAGCVSVPEGIEPVKDFQAEHYLGKWYEIARLDHTFERGMQQVTAEYSLRDDGGIKVLNRGFIEDKKEWKEAQGKAYFVEDQQTGYLKVSFFGPFYGSYIIFDLDQDYQYSVVSGPDRSYLWLLSRSPTLPAELQARLIEKMTALGFATDQLIFVDQSSHLNPAAGQ